MNFIRSINFAVFPYRGLLSMKETYQSLDQLMDTLKPNMIILTPAGVQENAHSTVIHVEGMRTCTDGELIDMIRYIHAHGIQTALKPTVNCMDGTWRAYISFIEPDSPAQAKWGDWFAAYTDFQLHYARIAQAEGCALFLTGCEMVMADHRSEDWRRLIAAVRKVYTGPVGYNCDKYREDQVDWWDSVDIIASSGYYPADDWERQLDRIEKAVLHFKKPFFFSQLGCMAVKGANKLPNDWNLHGEPDPQGQVEWFKNMFEATQKRAWLRGYAFWDWAAIPSQPREAGHSYDLSISPALSMVAEVYEKLRQRDAQI